jgi:glutaminyl-peptide cyclotransferase
VVFVVLGTRKNRQTSSHLASTRVDTGQPTLFTFNIVKEFDHDPQAFTQGFEVYRSNDQPTFIESTGLRGKSTVRHVDIATGHVLRSTSLHRTDFGEGITRLGDTLYQLTWQSPKLISYNVHDFSKQQVHKTSLNDGWGITNDGSRLIVGDSSHMLYFLDPKTMKILDTIAVKDADMPVVWLNELEWVDGLIYANIWQKECIAQIEPSTGNIVGWIDLSGITNKIRASSKQRIDVLNGIAWDEEDGALYITGKLWPKVYQIELRPLYVDSKTAHVKEMTDAIRQRCIVSS